MDDSPNDQLQQQPAPSPQLQQQQQTMTPQYTITLDGQTIKANQIHYKIEPAKPLVTVQDQQQPQQTQTYSQQNYSK